MGELGSRLVRAREARGLSLGDAERDTRISRRYLEALEVEQFDVIPAPVYARGFLRSYSQYLGEDPLEMLALFPRDGDDEPPPTGGAAVRPSMQTPVSGSSPSRPVWKRPARPQTPVRPGAGRPGQNTVQPPPSSVPYTPQDEPVINFVTPSKDGPTIGVDIGLPAPAWRINPNAAGQSRSVLVLAFAVAAVIGVVLLAVLISNLGGDSKTAPSPTTTVGAGTPTATRGAAATTTQGAGASATAGPSGLVPSVKGLSATEAKRTLEAAGYVVRELHSKSNQQKNTITDQAPASETPLDAGREVTIVISDGP